jgi:hypothetical protein
MALRDHIIKEVTFLIQCSCGVCHTVTNGTQTQAARDFKVQGWVSHNDDVFCRRCVSLGMTRR